MDFRGEQQHEARFIYVLSFTPRKALVEYTLFSEHTSCRERNMTRLSGSI